MSVRLIYSTLRMLGYMGLTLLLSLQNTHPSNQQWFPDIVQNTNTSPVRYSWHASAKLLMNLHFLTGNHNSEKKKKTGVNHFQEEFLRKVNWKHESIKNLPPRSSLEDTRRGELFPGSIFNDSLYKRVARGL